MPRRAGNADLPFHSGPGSARPGGPTARPGGAILEATRLDHSRDGPLARAASHDPGGRVVGRGPAPGARESRW